MELELELELELEFENDVELEVEAEMEFEMEFLLDVEFKFTHNGVDIIPEEIKGEVNEIIVSSQLLLEDDCFNNRKPFANSFFCNSTIFCLSTLSSA